MALTDGVGNPDGQKTMVVFFVVCASGNGEKIAAANKFVGELILKIRELEKDKGGVQIKIAALAYADGARWITDSPADISKFQWKNIDAVSDEESAADFGAACKALNEKLSTKAFMREYRKSYAPQIFLISDGHFSDGWKEPFERLKKNGWFNNFAVKYAVTTGDDVDKKTLAMFTGYIERVLQNHDAESLAKKIKFIDGKEDYFLGEVKYSDGNVYNGESYSGEPHGYGEMIYANGNTYEGDWKHGVPSGKGRKTYKDGRAYEGDFVDGKPHGKGKGIAKDGAVKNGYWENGVFKG